MSVGQPLKRRAGETRERPLASDPLGGLRSATAEPSQRAGGGRGGRDARQSTPKPTRPETVKKGHKSCPRCCEVKVHELFARNPEPPIR